MKKLIPLTLSLLLASMAVRAAEPAQKSGGQKKQQRPMPKAEWLDPAFALSARGQQPVVPMPTPGTAKSTPGKRGAFSSKKRPMPKAEWLDPDRSAPNGTQYKTFTSKVLGREVSYLIYLPPDYEQQPAKRYPVIYWLHGMGANQQAGATMFVPHVEEAIKEELLPPCIVVSVNGMVRSYYCDSSDGKLSMESVIIKDLIPHIDQTYRTVAKREGRVMEGYSMGGLWRGAPRVQVSRAIRDGRDQCRCTARPQPLEHLH